MSIDFTRPLAHLELLSNDGVTHYYLRENLVRSCRFFSDLLADFVEEQFPQVKVELTGRQINLFLNFLHADQFPSSIDSIIDVIEACDYFDLQYLRSGLKDKRDVINCVWVLIVYQSELRTRFPKAAMESFEMIDEFLLSKSLDNQEWRGIYYMLTHLEELTAYSKIYLVKEFKKFSESYLKHLSIAIPWEMEWIVIFNKIKESVNLDQPESTTYERLKEKIQKISEDRPDNLSIFHNRFTELGLL